MVIETMTFQGNLIQASIEEAINPISILGRAINRGSILKQSNKSKTYCGKAINRGSILEQCNKSKSYFGKAINPVYCSLPNNRLKLTAPSVHAFCSAADVEDLGRGA